MSILWDMALIFLRGLWQTLPAFLLGVTIGAVIKTFRWDLRLRARFQDAGPAASIPFAVLLGVFSPLCACGILPVVISLALSGVALPPLLALLASSPLMSPDAFAITWAGLGPAYAWTKLLSAAGMGFFVGYVTYVLEKRSHFLRGLVRIKPLYQEDGSLAPAYDIACASGFSLPTMTVRPRDNRFLFFLDRFGDLGLFVGKFLLLALVLQAVMETFIPMEVVRVLAGSPGGSSLVFAALLGVPLPAHQVAVVPVIRGLLDLGMDPGAAATLLVAGPVTSLPALFVLWRVFRPRLVALYTALCLAGAILTGVLFRLLA